MAYKVVTELGRKLCSSDTSSLLIPLLLVLVLVLLSLLLSCYEAQIRIGRRHVSQPIHICALQPSLDPSSDIGFFLHSAICIFTVFKIHKSVACFIYLFVYLFTWWLILKDAFIAVFKKCRTRTRGVIQRRVASAAGQPSSACRRADPVSQTEVLSSYCAAAAC